MHSFTRGIFAGMLALTLLGGCPCEDPIATGPRCTVIKHSIEDAGFASAVTVTCDAKYAWLASNTYPAHEKMTGITGTNEQVPIPAVNFSSPIPLKPSGITGLLSRDAALGVAVNGVPIYDYTSGGEINPRDPYDPAKDVVVTGQLDICGGHAGKGDDYHYHKAPNCMMDSMPNKGAKSIIGWAYDGYPIYGFENPDGTAIAKDALDLCNGIVDPTFGYRYHATVAPPYILKCLRGAVDASIIPRVPPLWGSIGGKPDGRPPRGGVKNLTFTEGKGGKRTMTYTYQGKSYYMKYEPSGTPTCYEFTLNTITYGKLEGEYCRE